MCVRCLPFENKQFDTFYNLAKPTYGDSSFYCQIIHLRKTEKKTNPPVSNKTTEYKTRLV